MGPDGKPTSLHYFGCIKDTSPRQDTPNLRVDKHAIQMVKNIDMRADCPEIYDQGELNSCVSNAVSFMIEFIQKKYEIPHNIMPSRLYIYYNTRDSLKTIQEDSGATIIDTLISTNHDGYCSELDWMYDVTKFSEIGRASCRERV